MQRMTLLELSNKLVGEGYPDLFDFAVDGDILDLDRMIGSVADFNGDNIVEFKIVKIGTDTSGGCLTHLDTIVELKENKVDYKAIVETENGLITNIYPYNKEKLEEYFDCLKEDMDEDLVREMIEDDDIIYFNKYGDSIRIYALSKEEATSFAEILLHS